ncbi:MAG: hypothetical protein B7Z55_01785 [Planctomycetales bacterium 12-60-4]|nr:MAG: hypothetical protein B7Z55_01785 [Planctomycetales bacterium 12-60-4]
MTMPKCLRWLACLCWVLFGEAVLAESPLAEYVAGDAALYAEVSNLDRDWTAFDESPFGQRWRTSRLYGLLAETPAGRRWKVLDEKVAAETGQTLTRHLRELCARQVAVALHLPDQGEPRALLLARGESSTAMSATIAAWNRLESQVRLTTRKADGRDRTPSVESAATSKSQRRSVLTRRFNTRGLENHCREPSWPTSRPVAGTARFNPWLMVRERLRRSSRVGRGLKHSWVNSASMLKVSPSICAPSLTRQA